MKKYFVNKLSSLFSCAVCRVLVLHVISYVLCSISLLRIQSSAIRMRIKNTENVAVERVAFPSHLQESPGRLDPNIAKRPQKRSFGALGVSQRPLTLILPQKYRDTNGRRIVIQIGGVYTTFSPREGIHLQKYAIEMGGVSRYFFTCIGVRGRCDSPKGSGVCRKVPENA